MKLRIRLLDVVVEIHAEDPEAARLLSLLWSQMFDDSHAAPAREYVVGRDADGGWVATAGDRVEAVHETLWGVTDALRYRMLELCEEGLEHFVTLHAAAVAHRGNLVLLAGGSGAGKTTLTIALLEAGWTYFSDDLAPVSLTTGQVHPFPKPLGVKDPSAWSALLDAFSGTSLAPPTGAFLVPPARWRVATNPARASALLFPTFTAGAPLEVERLSPGKAAALASSYLRRLDPPRVAMLNRLCSGATALRLEYGSSEQAIAAIEDGINARE